MMQIQWKGEEDYKGLLESQNMFNKWHIGSFAGFL